MQKKLKKEKSNFGDQVIQEEFMHVDDASRGIKYLLDNDLQEN